MRERERHTHKIHGLAMLTVLSLYFQVESNQNSNQKSTTIRHHVAEPKRLLQTSFPYYFRHPQSFQEPNKTLVVQYPSTAEITSGETRAANEPSRAKL